MNPNSMLSVANFKDKWASLLPIWFIGNSKKRDSIRKKVEGYKFRIVLFDPICSRQKKL